MATGGVKRWGYCCNPPQAGSSSAIMELLKKHALGKDELWALLAFCLQLRRNIYRMNEMKRNKIMKGVDFNLFSFPITFLPSPFSSLSLLMINFSAWDNACCINQCEVVFLDSNRQDKEISISVFSSIPPVLPQPTYYYFHVVKVYCSIYLLFSVYRLILNIKH